MKHEFILTKLIRVQDKKDTTWDAYNEILSYLDENTEGVSDASDESGVLHSVSESHASEPTDTDSLAAGELPLEKRTDYENKCRHNYRSISDVGEVVMRCLNCGKIR